LLSKLNTNKNKNYNRKTDIARDFMRHYNDYPVVRVMIRPGEAYLAPTENIIHDGSSANKNLRDLHITWRGKIDTFN
jgi:hypothetical protein